VGVGATHPEGRIGSGTAAAAAAMVARRDEHRCDPFAIGSRCGSFRRQCI